MNGCKPSVTEILERVRARGVKNVLRARAAVTDIRPRRQSEGHAAVLGIEV